jgi:tRNA(Ile)-lysidine synthase
MLDRFLEHIQRSDMIPEGARVLVGYSGGADSTCLLHLLHSAGVAVVAAHLHHGQRPEAEGEMRQCEIFASSLGVDFAAGRADVPQIAEAMKVGLEEAGRHARYEFFRQAAFRFQCPLIATAHTLDDHVETVLLHAVRGSGLAGLAGIPERRGEIVRPLRPFTRSATREYCRERGFWFHDDPANEDPRFARVRMRRHVMPELRKINAAVEESIARLAATASEEDAFLDGMAAAALEQSEIPLNGDLRFLTEDAEVAFERPKLLHLPPVLLKRALRLAVRALGPTLDSEQTLALFDGVRGHASGAVTADGGEVAAEWTGSRVHVREVRPTEPFRYPLTLPGQTTSEEFGWEFTAYPVDGPGPDVQPRASLSVQIDAERVRGGLHFRTAKTGDEMQPLGFEGKRKLSDLLSESKLTAAARARLPIVCDLVGPIWAPGVCLDERVRASKESKSTVILRFGRTPLPGQEELATR